MSQKVTSDLTIVTSDYHVPLHSEECLDALIDFVKFHKPTRFIINGDFADMQSVSRHPKDPENTAKLQDELDECNRVLRRLEKALPKECEKVYIEGNHEIRINAYINSTAPALASVREELSLPKLLELDENGWDYVSARSRGGWIMLEDVAVGHFDRVLKHSAYTVKALVDEYMCSVIQGHTHRMGTYYKTRLDGSIIKGQECGCLCETDVDYLDTTNWQNGFCIIERYGKRYNITEIPIFDGAILFGGRRFGKQE